MIDFILNKALIKLNENIKIIKKEFGEVELKTTWKESSNLSGGTYRTFQLTFSFTYLEVDITLIQNLVYRKFDLINTDQPRVFIYTINKTPFLYQGKSHNQRVVFKSIRSFKDTCSKLELDLNLPIKYIDENEFERVYDIVNDTHSETLKNLGKALNNVNL